MNLSTEQKIRLALGLLGLALMCVAIIGFFGWWGVLFVLGFVLDHAMSLLAKKE
jgi:hypothetical protein